MKHRILPWLGLWGALMACGGITQPLGDANGAGGGAGKAGSAAAGKDTGGSEISSSGGATSEDPLVPRGGTSVMGPIPTAGTGSAGKTSSTTDPYAQEPCYAPCAEEIFRDPTGCKLCHSPTFAASGLDLDSLGRAARLKDVAAKHADLQGGQDGCPQGDKLIDSANVQASWMLKKIRGEQGSCGSQEPPIAPLAGAELGCLTMYIGCIATQ